MIRKWFLDEILALGEGGLGATLRTRPGAARGDPDDERQAPTVIGRDIKPCRLQGNAICSMPCCIVSAAAVGLDQAGYLTPGRPDTPQRRPRMEDQTCPHSIAARWTGSGAPSSERTKGS